MPFRNIFTRPVASKDTGTSISKKPAGDGIVDIDIIEFCQTLVANAPDAIIYADAAGLIRFWNHGAERLFGFPKEEAIGQTLDIIIPATLRKRHWDGYSRTMQTGLTKYGDGNVLAVPALRKNGSRVSIEFTILPFHDRDKRVCGIAAVLRDVDKRYEETKALHAELAALRLSHQGGILQN
jgi:PAS domain S-box-containing protein